MHNNINSKYAILDNPIAEKYLHSDTDWRIPNAFSSRKISVHMLLSFGLDNFHPFDSVQKNHNKKHQVNKRIKQSIIVLTFRYSCFRSYINTLPFDVMQKKTPKSSYIFDVRLWCLYKTLQEAIPNRHRITKYSTTNTFNNKRI